MSLNKDWNRFLLGESLDDRNIFNCPVTIIDPKYADDDNRLVTTIFDPYEAADYLTWKRSR